jgi:hypothetical protein
MVLFDSKYSRSSTKRLLPHASQAQSTGQEGQAKKRAIKSTASKAANQKEANEQSTNVKKRVVKSKEPNADNEREAYVQRMRLLYAEMAFAAKDLQTSGWGKLTDDLSQLWPQFIGGVRIQGHQCELTWCTLCHSWASDGWDDHTADDHHVQSRHVGNLQSWDKRMCVRAILQSHLLMMRTKGSQWGQKALKPVSQACWDATAESDLRDVLESCHNALDECDEATDDEGGENVQSDSDDDEILCETCKKWRQNAALDITSCCRRCKETDGRLHGRRCVQFHPEPAVGVLVLPQRVETEMEIDEDDEDDEDDSKHDLVALRKAKVAPVARKQPKQPPRPPPAHLQPTVPKVVERSTRVPHVRPGNWHESWDGWDGWSSNESNDVANWTSNASHQGIWTKVTRTEEVTWKDGGGR